MSRRTAIVTGAIGALVGAGAGIPWLIRWEECAGLGDGSVQCTMNQTLAPFLSAIAIGFVVAVVLGNLVAVIARRSVKPNATPRESRAAVEIDDPMTQIAAWGMPPGASQRTVSLSEPLVLRRRLAATKSKPGGRRPGAGYSAAREARTMMLVTDIRRSHPTSR